MITLNKVYAALGNMDSCAMGYWEDFQARHSKKYGWNGAIPQSAIRAGDEVNLLKLAGLWEDETVYKAGDHFGRKGQDYVIAQPASKARCIINS